MHDRFKDKEEWKMNSTAYINVMFMLIYAKSKDV